MEGEKKAKKEREKREARLGEGEMGRAEIEGKREGRRGELWMIKIEKR